MIKGIKVQGYLKAFSGAVILMRGIRKGFLQKVTHKLSLDT